MALAWICLHCFDEFGMYSSCTRHILIMYSLCTYILVIYSPCTHLILDIYSSHSRHVLILYSSCSRHVLVMYSSYTRHVLIVYSSYSPCTGNYIWVCFRNLALVILMLKRYSGNWLVIQINRNRDVTLINILQIFGYLIIWRMVYFWPVKLLEQSALKGKEYVDNLVNCRNKTIKSRGPQWQKPLIHCLTHNRDNGLQAVYLKSIYTS